MEALISAKLTYICTTTNSETEPILSSRDFEFWNGKSNIELLGTCNSKILLCFCVCTALLKRELLEKYLVVIPRVESLLF